MRVFTPGQLRDFDQAAESEWHLPSLVLMENAALRVVEFLEAKFAPLAGKHVAVFCGKGNNGGDGFAIARHLLATGCRLTVLLGAKRELVKVDAATNLAALEAALRECDPRQAALIDIAAEAHHATLRERLLGADITVDALLGTGFSGVLRDDTTVRALALLTGAPSQRIAVDLPSGLDAETGEAAPELVRAHYTVTFAAPKRGFFVRDGVDVCGEMWVGAIGTAPAHMASTPTGCELLTADLARSLLPRRKPDAHKGDAGKVVVIGGSTGMSGAPSLASRAALQVGAGLCITCLPTAVQPIFAAAVLEATSHALPCDGEGRLVAAAAEALPSIWNGAQVVALGPGLSRSAGALDFARHVVREWPGPLIVDADALYALRNIADEVKTRTAPTILTPHPGEMAELMECDTAHVQLNRLATAIACADCYGATVVLKGARSIVATPVGLLSINLTGNSGMATGGSGDVLTGTIAGLLVQLRDAESATRLGVYLHGLAGDLAFATKGNGLVAGDIAAHLAAALLTADTARSEKINARLCRLM